MRAPDKRARLLVLGIGSYAAGMCLSGTGATYAAFYDFAIVHGSASAGV